MGIQTVGCMNCGLAQTWPRPTPKEMSTFYKKDYRLYYQTTNTPDNEYVNHFNKNIRLKYTADLIAENIEIFPGMKILDIGCAEGTLLAKLKEQCENLLLTGIEPSENFASYAIKSTGCKTYSTLDQLKSSKQHDFNLIILNHVLEHIDNPVRFLTELKELLIWGGEIYIDVPDVAKYEGAECLHIAHLFHFSQHTLAAAVKKAGFWVLSTKHHSPPYHPASVLCLAKRKDSKSNPSTTDPNYEKDAWDRIQCAGAESERFLYSLKLHLRRNRFTWFFLKKLRNLYRNISKQ